MDANKSKEREEYKEKMYQYRIRGQIDLSIFMNCRRIVKNKGIMQIPCHTEAYYEFMVSHKVLEERKEVNDTVPHGGVL